MSEACGETMEIEVPHFEARLNHTVTFRCERKPGHRMPHTPHVGFAAKYDKEDAESMTLAEAVHRAEVEAVKSSG
jgi:hypothetical protein